MNIQRRPAPNPAASAILQLFISWIVTKFVAIRTNIHTLR